MKLECPYCHADIVRRIRMEGPIERLSNLFSFYSFRCQLCAQRFRSRLSGSEIPTLSGDKRQFERLLTHLPAMVVGANERSDDVITDLSIAGCTLHTSASLDRGAFVHLRLRPSMHEPVIFIETAMVRSTRYQTVGLEFLEFEREEKTRLSQFIRSLFLQRAATAMA